MIQKSDSEKSTTIISNILRHILDRSDPESLLNKKDHKGQTPLYVVCKNGYLNVHYLLI